MSAQNYRGLCVGGPRDGEWAVSQSAYFPVLCAPELRPVHVGAFDVAKAVMPKTVQYVQATVRTSTRDFPLWRPHDQSIEDTLDRLFVGYRP